MIEDRLPEIVKSTYNFKVLVHANTTARQSLDSKGITPAIFSSYFYQNHLNDSNLEIGYEMKDKTIKPLTDIVAIDIEEYECFKKEIINGNIHSNLEQSPLKYQHNVTKYTFEDKQKIEHHLNNINFTWFHTASRIFFYALTLDPSGFKISTLDQPIAILYIIQVDESPSPLHYNQLKKETDLYIHNMYALNPHHINKISTFIILLYDAQKGTSTQQAAAYYDSLCTDCKLNADTVIYVEINSDKSQPEEIWSKCSNINLHYHYNKQPTEQIRLLDENSKYKLSRHIQAHKETIRKNIEVRINSLIDEHDKVNTTRNKIMSLFRVTSPTDKSLGSEEVQLRELADLLFLLEDYKQAYDLYRALADKINQKERFMEGNTSFMIHLCLCMSKFHCIKIKSDPISIIEKEFERTLSLSESTDSNYPSIRYLIFILYAMHTFKVYNENFIKNFYLKQIKIMMHQEKSPLGCLLPVLLYEQHASIHLLNPEINYRMYCYDLVMVATKFNEFKLYNHSMRCYCLVEKIYEDSFEVLEKYIFLQLGSTCMELGYYKEALGYVRRAWQKFMTQKACEHREQNVDYMNITATIQKIVNEVSKKQPEILNEPSEEPMICPSICSLNVEVQDESISRDYQHGIKWEKIGESIIDSKELISHGMSKKYYIKLIKSFDCVKPEEKELIHRIKSKVINESIIKKHARITHLNEPIKVYFVFSNLMNYTIHVDHINLNISNNSAEYEIIEQSHTKEDIKPFNKKRINFKILPKSEGLISIESLSWTFMNIRCDYPVIKPENMPSELKSCYFKLQVVPAVGELRVECTNCPFYYEGEVYEMKLTMHNVGSESIDYIKVSLGSDDGISYELNKSLDITLDPLEYKTTSLKLHAPCLPSKVETNEYRIVYKMIFLYRSQNSFRIARLTNEIRILRVCKLSKIYCERLSTHLHLLSFILSKEIKDHYQLINEIVIRRNFEIAKVEASEQSNKFLYYFFLRQNKGLNSRSYHLPQKEDKFSVIPEMDELCEENSNTVELALLWNDDTARYGYIKPEEPIRIVNVVQNGTNNEYLPFNFKISYEATVDHSFTNKGVYRMPITIKIKNIFYNEMLTLGVYFTEQTLIQSTWSGIIEHKLNLQHNEEATINIDLLLFQKGIYDISSSMKYIVTPQYINSFNLTHSEYERIYITVNDISEPTSMKKPIDLEERSKTVDLL